MTETAAPPAPEETVEKRSEEPAGEPAKEPAREAAFTADSISAETFSSVKIDIQNLIADLNRIIRARNYNAWVEHLTESYIGEISSGTFLEEKTEELYRRDQTVAANMGRDPRAVTKRLLKTPMDYFTHVVVPSRSNDRVDDITFFSETHVRAYIIDTRGNRLVLYDLEYIKNNWKITS